jgi:hypothetical protein
MSESHTTTDHKKIKKWAEERDGVPATVRATETKGHAGILRIDFGPKEEALEEISWDEFFKKFDEAGLGLFVPGQNQGRRSQPLSQVCSARRGLTPEPTAIPAKNEFTGALPCCAVHHNSAIRSNPAGEDLCPAGENEFN